MKNKIISSFSRTVGRTLSHTQKGFLRGQLQNFLISPDSELSNIFTQEKREIYFEIGFGSGEHIATLAESNLDKLFLGCEPFLNGVANLLKQIQLKQLHNIRIWKNDARNLLAYCPDNRLEKIYILFPDPWPKVKHHKRRIISHQTLDLLHAKLKSDAEVIIATDHTEYANHVKRIISTRTDFTLTKDLRTQPEFWVKTRYQLKAESAGLEPYFFVLRKTL